MSHHPAGARYEVMFLLDAAAESIPELRARWSPLGDAILVENGARGWNCHIHTDHIGPVLEAALLAGRPRGIQVTDLLDGAGVPSHASRPSFEAHVEAAVAPVGVVAVVAGDGLVEIFSSLLVQGIVDGGRGMHPTTDALLEVVDAVPANKVIVLPNNKTLVPVAEQLDALSIKDVLVVPTRSVQQGVAAMLGYSTGEESLEDAAQTMSAAASSIITAEMTEAVRDARVDGLGDIARGDWMGVLDGTPIVAAPDVWSAMRQLARRIMTAPIERVTLYCGVQADAEVTDAFVSWISEEYPRTTIEVRAGGQPGHPYLLSFE